MKIELKQKELAEGIRQGINLSIEDTLRSILFSVFVASLFVLLIIFIGLPLYDSYDRYRCEKNPDSCKIQVVTAPAILKCDKEFLDCIVVDNELEQERTGCLDLFDEGKIDIEICRNLENPIIGEKRDLCGYQEANAWFEQYKRQINGGENLYLDCW